MALAGARLGVGFITQRRTRCRWPRSSLYVYMVPDFKFVFRLSWFGLSCFIVNCLSLIQVTPVKPPVEQAAVRFEHLPFLSPVVAELVPATTIVLALCVQVEVAPGHGRATTR
jgi:hypothetical protein